MHGAATLPRIFGGGSKLNCVEFMDELLKPITTPISKLMAEQSAEAEAEEIAEGEEGEKGEDDGEGEVGGADEEGPEKFGDVAEALAGAVGGGVGPFAGADGGGDEGVAEAAGGVVEDGGDVLKEDVRRDGGI